MAAVLSRSGIVWHAFPERLEPAAMDQVGEKIPDRTRSQDRQNWVLLNRTGVCCTDRAVGVRGWLA
jgi:hypothetical protein